MKNTFFINPPKVIQKPDIVHGNDTEIIFKEE